jgi:DNA mismatch endonuclease (patch repair protein)
MSAIKSKNTNPELTLRRALWAKGLRYRVNVKNLPGKPDIVFSKTKMIVFCDGDFWHGHNWALRGIASLKDELKRYTPFWRDKILKNIQRDKIITELLENDHWTVIRIWESDIKKSLDKCVKIIEKKYHSKLSRRRKSSLVRKT